MAAQDSETLWAWMLQCCHNKLELKEETLSGLPIGTTNEGFHGRLIDESRDIYVKKYLFHVCNWLKLEVIGSKTKIKWTL